MWHVNCPRGVKIIPNPRLTPRILFPSWHRTIAAWPDRDSWPVEGGQPLPLLGAKGRHHNLTLAGGGTINGRGERWWGAGSYAQGNRRPSLVSLGGVTGLRVQNLTLRAGACFQLLVLESSNVVIQGLTIEAGCGFKQAPNTDGIHLISVQGVLVRDANISNGDDCVVVSGDSRDVHVEGVRCRCSAGTAVIMPWASATGQNNITNVTFADMESVNASHCAGIKSESQYSGHVNDVLFSNIACTLVHWFAFYVNPFNQSSALRSGNGAAPAKMLGNFSADSITWRNVSAALVGDRNPGHFWCAPGQCTNLVFDRVRVTGLDKAYQCNDGVDGRSTASTPRPCFAPKTAASGGAIAIKHDDVPGDQPPFPWVVDTTRDLLDDSRVRLATVVGPSRPSPQHPLRSALLYASRTAQASVIFQQ